MSGLFISKVLNMTNKCYVYHIKIKKKIDILMFTFKIKYVIISHSI